MLVQGGHQLSACPWNITAKNAIKEIKAYTAKVVNRQRHDVWQITRKCWKYQEGKFCSLFDGRVLQTAAD